MSLYTTEQRKAYVRAALKWLESYERAPAWAQRDEFRQAQMLRENIARYTPKGHDPLDWSTEP